MKSKFSRSAFIPKNAIELADPQSSAVAYLMPPTDPAMKYCAKGFSGKRTRHDWYYSFKDESAARAHVARHFENVRSREARRKQNAATRQANACRTALDVWNKVRNGGPHGSCISAAETAICLRAGLAIAFPGIKFSVTTQTYSGGSSLHVRWTDGPTTKTVDRIAQRYSFKGFDGMVDCAFYDDNWLARDGTMTLAHSPGHAGGGGRESIGSPHSADCVLVTGGAGYVSCTRDRSFTSLFNQARVLAGKYRVTMPETFANDKALQDWLATTRVDFGTCSGGGEWMSTLLWQEETEDLPVTETPAVATVQPITAKATNLWEETEGMGEN